MPRVAKASVAIDASVAIPLIVRAHEHHEAVRAWRRGVSDLTLCGHAWWETYSVVTRMHVPFRITPHEAQQLMSRAFVGPLIPHAKTWAGSLEAMVGATIFGGATYDAWIALTARDHGVVLATRDRRAIPIYRALGATVEVVGAA